MYRTFSKLAVLIATLGLIVSCASTQFSKVEIRGQAQILEQAQTSEWRSPDPENLLYMQLETGLVIIELAPEFAPNHVANTKALVREQYFNGLFFYRVAEGFVAQAGDPKDDLKPIKNAKRSLEAELYKQGELSSSFTLVDKRDGFAAESGFMSGFPVARNTSATETWLTHCPGAFAMARGDESDSGGATVYIVIGHAPRYLDRNTTVFGRVLMGLEYVQQLRRGYKPAGFIESPEDYNPIVWMRVAADIPISERINLEIMRTDSESFEDLIYARANRPEAWFYERPGYVDVCGVPVPVRRAAKK